MTSHLDAAKSAGEIFRERHDPEPVLRDPYASPRRTADVIAAWETLPPGLRDIDLAERFWSLRNRIISDAELAPSDEVADAAREIFEETQYKLAPRKKAKAHLDKRLVFLTACIYERNPGRPKDVLDRLADNGGNEFRDFILHETLWLGYPSDTVARRLARLTDEGRKDFDKRVRYCLKNQKHRVDRFLSNASLDDDTARALDRSV